MGQDKSVRARVDGRAAVSKRTMWQLDVMGMSFRCLRNAQPVPVAFEVQMKPPRKAWQRVGEGNDAAALLQKVASLATVTKVLVAQAPKDTRPKCATCSKSIRPVTPADDLPEGAFVHDTGDDSRDCDLDGSHNANPVPWLRQKALDGIVARGGEGDWHNPGYMLDATIEEAKQRAEDGGDQPHADWAEDGWKAWARNARISPLAFDDAKTLYLAAYVLARNEGP